MIFIFTQNARETWSVFVGTTSVIVLLMLYHSQRYLCSLVLDVERDSRFIGTIGTDLDR